MKHILDIDGLCELRTKKKVTAYFRHKYEYF